MTETFTHDDDRNINNNLSTYSITAEEYRDERRCVEPIATIRVATFTAKNRIGHYVKITCDPFPIRTVFVGVL